MIRSVIGRLESKIMKTLKERALIPDSLCNFEATAETNEQIQILFAVHFNVDHAAQRALMSPAYLRTVDQRAFDLLSKM